MNILLINPNTTVGMTEKIEAAANRAAASGTQITAVTSASGPVSIEGYYDEALSVPGLLKVIRDSAGFDAVVIACFDDTGLDAARCVTDKPVIGIGEAAYSLAGMLANKFSVVTTLARSVPALEHNLMKYGLDRRCARVRSSEVAVLDLENDSSGAYEKIAAEIARAIADDKAEAIVLGCAGMTDLANKLSQHFDRPVLDGVACAVSLAEAMARLQLKTTRHGGYAPPPQHKLEVQP
ncbi:aspartate/glutamate racemase family protein [Comamonadaceae bacterium M7527]|nr:aspartate/glutamate racemase family protein [Comamonadaceae bacterium M7527]